MDKQNKPQQTSEEEVPAPPAAPPAVLQARNPYRPLSRRRRQDQVPEPPPAVDRPAVSMKFDASPTKISAALAKAGASGAEPVLVWKGGAPAGSAGERADAAEAGADIEVIDDADADG